MRMFKDGYFFWSRNCFLNIDNGSITVFPNSKEFIIFHRYFKTLKLTKYKLDLDNMISSIKLEVEEDSTK